MTTSARILRDLLSAQQMVVAPGAYDCITARLIEEAGFPAVYMTGAGASATLGYPDYGLLTMSEMADNAGRIANAVRLPVIADADTGYGNELNTVRTVREYERRGVAGLHIEDQEFPKRCGHLDDKRVIATEDFVAKVKAAVTSRRDPDFLVIARTDARAVLGFEEAIRRANASLAAGADMAFVEAPQTLEEVMAVPKLVNGPCLLNMVWRGKTPELSLDQAEEAGFKLVIMPSLLVRSVVGTCSTMLDDLKRSRRHPRPPVDISLHESFARLGSSEWDGYRERFRQPAVADEQTSP